MSNSCFHCDEVVLKGISLFVTINDVKQAMCCVGCQAVANSIMENGLESYYQFRTEPAQKNTPLVPKQLLQNKLLDDDELQDEFTYKTEQYKEAILTIDGISCSACAWLIEMQLTKLSGIISINVNATTQRATVRWNEKGCRLSEIIAQIDSVGYHAQPFKANITEQLNKARGKTFIKRLGISGILMMQVMMIATGLYFGAFSGMSTENLVYLRWISLLLTIPIVSYGALPFYTGAINALKLKRLSMDVPVSVAILLAFSASAWATFSQQGEVYFESVSMFTFLLLVGKFLEFRARARAAEVSANLLKLMPMTATKLVDHQEVFIAAKKLIALDIVLVKPGEIVPADGIILTGNSQLNEAMLTGEQLPIDKAQGEKVFAGTINGDGNITIEVKDSNNHSFLNQLIRLSESSLAHKPKIAELSDKIAQYFVAIILFAALSSAIYWQYNLPEQAFWITLSVLVATCPCALSLATPTALTCATTRLNKDGIMVKSNHVMETIPKIDCFAFDKTGTLTSGEFSIKEIITPLKEHIKETQSSESPKLLHHYDQQEILAIAAALELHSEHPIAKAFIIHRDLSLKPEQVTVHSGAGIVGTINQQVCKFGKPSWLLKQTALAKYEEAQCVLLIDDIFIAAFYLEDSIREDAKSLISKLKAQKYHCLMLSGDNQKGCTDVAQALSIKEVFSGLSATDKMHIIQKKQSVNTIAMIGDGVNDSPVFSAAHVAIAMGSGTDVAKNGADVILLNNKLNSLLTLKNIAIKTKVIIRQNYLWAFTYNLIMLPLAMSGYITPYFAVIGMSASSILVISNSLRLLKK
jgi:Cu2+-exporting ATPase